MQVAKGSEASTVWSGSVKYCIKSLSEVQFAVMTTILCMISFYVIQMSYIISVFNDIIGV